MKYIFNTDADEILYASAFCCEQTAYKVIVKGKEYNFGTKYDRKQIIQELGLQGKANKLDYEIQTYKVPTGPVSHAIHCCKNIIEHLESISSEVRLFLTADNKSNFRFSIAKTEGPNGLGYKAGRPSRPIYYNEVREWLLKRGAEEIEDMEADDALGIYQTEDTVACHQDKDINRVIGKHYNWKTRERTTVENKEGRLWLNEKKDLKGVGNAFFFAQMLLGDRVDNIPTLIGYDSHVAVYSLLEGCKTEMDYFNVVRECYYNHYGVKEYKDKLNEMADLLYIIDSEKITGREYLDRMRKHSTLALLANESQELNRGINEGFG